MPAVVKQTNAPPTKTFALRLPHLMAHGGAMLFYAALAIAITWPLAAVLDSRFAGHPFSDSYELARHIWWLAHALQTGQPLFDAPLLAYPDGLSGALLWAYPLQSWPAALLALVIPLPAAFNLSLLLTLTLNGWSMWLLARCLTGHNAAALVAGTVFLTYPTFQAHLAAGHAGLLALWPFALYACALLRLRAAPGRGGVVAGAVLLAMSGWGGTQLLIFTVAPLTVAVMLTLLYERHWRGLLYALAMTAAGGLLAMVFALPLLRDALNEPGWLRLQTGVIDYSTDLLAVVTPSYLHPLTGQNPLSPRILGVDPFEATAYVGAAAGALALVGVWRWRAARWWLVLALVAWVFSLGPLLRVGGEPLQPVFDGYQTNVVLPWAALYDLPLVSITRTPGRFNFLVGFAVALMAAYGMTALAARLPQRWGAPVALMLAALVTFDAQFWWHTDTALPDLPTVDGVIPPQIATLAGRDDLRAVLDIPWAHPLAAKQGLWLQTGHQRPLIAGHMARQTPVDPAKLTLLETTLDPALLDAAGADVVILHREWDDAGGLLEAHTRRRLGPPVYEDDRFAVFLVALDGAPVFTAMPELEDTLTDELYTFAYAPDATAARLTGRLNGPGRVVSVLLNEQLVDVFRVDGDFALDLPLTLAPGYHRLTLTVDPPCAAEPEIPLACRDVHVRELQILADTAASG